MLKTLKNLKPSWFKSLKSDDVSIDFRLTLTEGYTVTHTKEKYNSISYLNLNSNENTKVPTLFRFSKN